MASQEDWISRNYVATRATTEFEWESTEFYLNLEKPNTITVYTILPPEENIQKTHSELLQTTPNINTDLYIQYGSQSRPNTTFLISQKRRSNEQIPGRLSPTRANTHSN